jgi:hypothetical protein
MSNWGNLWGKVEDSIKPIKIDLNNNEIILRSGAYEATMAFDDYLFMTNYNDWSLAYEYTIKDLNLEIEKLTNYVDEFSREDPWDKSNQNDLYSKYHIQKNGIRYRFFELYLKSNTHKGYPGKWLSLLDMGYTLGLNSEKLPEANGSHKAHIVLKNSSLRLKEQHSQKYIDSLVRVELFIYNQVYEHFHAKDDSIEGLYFDLEDSSYFDFLEQIDKFEDIKLFKLNKTLKPEWDTIIKNNQKDYLKSIDPEDTQHFHIVYENTSMKNSGVFKKESHLSLINYEAWIEKENVEYESKLVKVNRLIWFPTVFIGFY